MRNLHFNIQLQIMQPLFVSRLPEPCPLSHSYITSSQQSDATQEAWCSCGPGLSRISLLIAQPFDLLH
jgi:hypothetical protein